MVIVRGVIASGDRYIKVIGRLDPKNLSLEEMQLVATLSDKKVIQYLYDE